MDSWAPVSTDAHPDPTSGIYALKQPPPHEAALTTLLTSWLVGGLWPTLPSLLDSKDPETKDLVCLLTSTDGVGA